MHDVTAEEVWRNVFARTKFMLNYTVRIFIRLGE